jgi:hypothetical protein
MDCDFAGPRWHTVRVMEVPERNRTGASMNKIQLSLGAAIAVVWAAPSAGWAQRVGTDYFAQRPTLTGAAASGIANNTSATLEGDEPDHGQPTDARNTVWWRWVAPESRMVTITLQGAGIQPSLSVYVGSSFLTMSRVRTAQSTLAGQPAVLTFPAAKGVAYEIAGDSNRGLGTMSLQVTQATTGDGIPALPGANWWVYQPTLTGAVARGVVCNFQYGLDANFLYVGGSEPDHGMLTDDRNSAWWKWVAPANGTVTLVATGATVQPVLAVYAAVDATHIARVRTATGALIGQPAAVSFSTVAGQLYHIAADTRNGVGNLTLDLRLAANAAAPAGRVGNDDFVLRPTLSGAVARGEACNFTYGKETGESDHGLNITDSGGSCWWTWTAPQNGAVTLRATAPLSKAILSTYTGRVLGALGRVGTANSAALGGTATSTFPVVAGRVYQIATDTSGSRGNLTLDLQFVAGAATGDAWDPVDNVAAGATQLPAPYATWQAHSPHTLSATDGYDWFRVYLNGGQLFTAESANNTGDLMGDLYADPAGATLVASDDDSAGSQNFRIAYTPALSGWHTLRVRTFTAGAAAAYSLQYRTQSAVAAPALAVSPTLLQRSVVAGGVAPAQSFTVRNAGGGTLSYAVAASSGWLRVNPSSGTSTGEYDTLNVLYDTAALAPGRYTAYLTVSSAGVAGSPAAVRVELDVQAGPRPGSLLDYDGDGLTDLSLFHPASACWDIYRSTTRTVGGFYQGRADSIPLLADFDGDGRVDHATYTAATGRWQIRQSRSGASLSIQFGWSAALPVPADYDGDGQADPGRSTTPPRALGTSARARATTICAWPTGAMRRAVPVPGDYDGDGRTDLAVMDRSNARWYVSLKRHPRRIDRSHVRLDGRDPPCRLTTRAMARRTSLCTTAPPATGTSSAPACRWSPKTGAGRPRSRFRPTTTGTAGSIRPSSIPPPATGSSATPPARPRA